MAIAFITSVAGHSGVGGGSFTTGTCDTTGSNLLTAMQTFYTAGNPFTVSDSKGNSWTNLTRYDSPIVPGCRTAYSTPTVVGSGHTFTLTGGSAYPTLAVLAFSGAKASSPFDAENGTSGTSSSGQSGSITPSENGEVVVASLGWNATTLNSINGGFTLQHNQPPVATECIAGAAAYLIQTSAAAANPTWTLNASDTWAANIASFKAAAAAAATPRSFGMVIG